MKLEEAFNSGYRFKLDDGSFAETVWWIKTNNKEFNVLMDDKYRAKGTLTTALELGDKESDLWIIHPDDQYKYEFNNTLTEILDE